ncbi:MAG: porin [Gaiellaceae bacterium]
MSRRAGVRIAVALVAAWGGTANAAEPTNAELLERIKKLEDQSVYVKDLEQEVQLLKRQLEVEEEAAASKGPAPVIGAGPDGFFLQSADKNFVIKLRGYTQLDSRFFLAESDEDPTNQNDTFIFRRVRPIVEGTVGGWADFRIMPDFANSQLVLQDAYTNLRPFGPIAQLQIGKYKSPFGLERLQSATALTFIERGLPTNLVPNRDLGFQLWGNVGEGLLTYQLAVMNGVTDGGSGESDNNDGKDIIARLFGHPFVNTTTLPLQGLGLGVAATWGRETGTPSNYRTSGQQTFFSWASGTQLDNDRFRISPQAYWYWGPFGLFGEYVFTSTDVTRTVAGGKVSAGPDADSWQLAASYVLTGENASYRGVTPRESFSPSKGTWGAFEVAARYDQLSIDEEVFEKGFANPSTSAREAQGATLGVNWYLNRFLKFGVNYEPSWFDGGAPDGGDRNAEDLVSTRFQLNY